MAGINHNQLLDLLVDIIEIQHQKIFIQFPLNALQTGAIDMKISDWIETMPENFQKKFDERIQHIFPE